MVQFIGAVPPAAWLLTIQDAAAKVFDSCDVQFVTFVGTKPAFKHACRLVTVEMLAQLLVVNPSDWTRHVAATAGVASADTQLETFAGT